MSNEERLDDILEVLEQIRDILVIRAHIELPIAQASEVATLVDERRRERERSRGGTQ